MLLSIEFGQAEQFYHANDAVHWRSDFVAHIGQKFAFGLCCNFSLILCFLQLCHQLLLAELTNDGFLRAQKRICEWRASRGEMSKSVETGTSDVAFI